MNIKKLIACTAISLLLLSGCGTAKDRPASGMEIKLTELTESEQQLLDFVGVDEDIMIFDYAINDKIRSISIEILTLDPLGKWEGQGGGVSSSIGMTDTKAQTGRFMLSLQNDGKIKLAEQHENGTTSWTSEAVYESLVGDGAKVGSRLDASTEIIPDQPIAVAMFGRSTKNTIRTYALSDYQNTAQLSDYDSVSVITVCFSEKALE